MTRCTIEATAKPGIVENGEGLALNKVTVNGKRLDA